MLISCLTPRQKSNIDNSISQNITFFNETVVLLPKYSKTINFSAFNVSLFISVYGIYLCKALIRSDPSFPFFVQGHICHLKCVCVCDAKVTQLHSFCLYPFIWGSIFSRCRLALSRHSAGFFHSANILHYFTSPPAAFTLQISLLHLTWLASYSSTPPLPSHGSHLHSFELRRNEWARSHWQLKLQTSRKLLSF